MSRVSWNQPGPPNVDGRVVTELRLGGYTGGDLSYLQDLQDLEVLHIWASRQHRVQLPELRLPKLRKVSGGYVDSIDPLKGCPALEEVFLTRHRMKHFDWAGSDTLRILSLREGPLRSLGAMSGFTALERLFVEENKLTELPPSLGTLPKLTGLRVRQNQLTALPFDTGHFVTFSAAGNPLGFVPDALLRPENTGIDLTRMNLTQVPEALRQCTQLHSLSLGRNQLHTIPEWVGDFEHLELIELHENPLKELPVALALAPKLRQVALGKTDFADRRRDIENLLKHGRTHDRDTRRRWHALITDGHGPFATAELVQDLGCKAQVVRMAAERQLQQLPTPFAQPFATIQLNGRLSIGKSELKQRLKDQGVKLVTKEGDVLVLGQKPRPVPHARIGTEAHLKAWLMEREGASTLMTGERETPEALGDMLASEDPDLVLQALELMEMAGLPAALATHVYAVAVAFPVDKTRKKAVALYKRFAPADLQTRTPTRSWRGHSEDAMTKTLHRMVGGGLDMSVLAAAVFRYTENGRSFCADGSIELANRGALLTAIGRRSKYGRDVEGELDLDRLNLKVLAPEVGQIPLKKLDVGGNKLTELPPLMHPLQELDVGYNRRLKALPPGTRARELDLGGTAIKTLDDDTVAYVRVLNLGGGTRLDQKRLVAQLARSTELQRVSCYHTTLQPVFEDFLASRPDLKVWR